MVDKTFRTYTDREHRAMAGLSWGGCQALIMSGSPGAAASRSLFLTSLNGKQTIRHNKSQNRLEERFWDFFIYFLSLNSRTEITSRRIFYYVRT